MELEFDKEIDALMRGGLAGHSKAGGMPDAHPDADEVSAFAENAMPEKTRALHMAHLADCDRCRKILSNLIALNVEEVPVEAAIAASAIRETAAPWYRRLFLFPNLAYVMGGLVLVFGGLLSFTLLQNYSGGDATSVSQIAETPSARGPMAPAEPQYSEGMPANAANSSANTNATVAPPGTAGSNAAANALELGTRLNTERATEEPSADKSVADITVDGASSNQPAEMRPAAAAPAPPPAKAAEVNEVAKDADALLARKEDQEREKAEAKLENADDAKKRSAKQTTQLPRTQAGGLAKAKPGPSRDMQQNFPNRSDNTYEMPMTRNLGGKTFNFRNGAWYDTAFRGQPTINVRRGSDEYRKLDRDLRSIAESINGTVVVVWGVKAYRIQ